MVDWPAWHYDTAGKFSVKSAYKLAVQIRDREAGHDASMSNAAESNGEGFPWYKIWQMKVPNKVKMFLWRSAHNSLQVRRNLKRRGVKTETVCPVCQRLDEDCGHLFLKCKQARAWWRVMNLDHTRQLLLQCQSGREVLLHIWRETKETQLKIITFLWRWWTARNKANAGERMWSLSEICSSVDYHLTEFAKLETPDKEVLPKNKMKWSPPTVSFYKLNVDASFL